MLFLYFLNQRPGMPHRSHRIFNPYDVFMPGNQLTYQFGAKVITSTFREIIQQQRPTGFSASVS